MYCWSASYNAILWQIRHNRNMKPIFPSLMTLALCLAMLAPAEAQMRLAQAGARPSAAGSSDGRPSADLLRRVLASLDAQHAIAAKVRQKVELLGHPMFGEGLYLQQGRGVERRLRFELALQASSVMTLVQVCDGANLWIYEDLGNRKNLSRVDLARLRRARVKSTGAAPIAMVGGPWLSLGGLPRLIGELDNALDWGPSSENLLDEELRVWTIEGRWKKDRLAEMLPDQKDAIMAGRAVDTTRLAPNLPDRIALHIGCDDLFPYRFEYWRSQSAAADDPQAARGKLLAVMEFYEVQIGAPIDPRRFLFKPVNLQPADRTQAFLERFGLEDPSPVGTNQNSPQRR
jgi:hypothetical protein